MKDYVDQSMNFFIYLTQEEITKLSKGLQGKLFRYTPKTTVPFRMNSNLKNPCSAYWKYS